MALQAHFGLRARQCFTARHTDLPFDQIEAAKRLGDGMLHLQARIHLHEKELAALDQKLHGARAHIASSLRQCYSARAELFAHRCIDRRAW